MKKEKIAENVFMFSSDGELSSNAYLIEAKEGRILIDSGAGDYDFGFEPDACILTHAHYDHTGGVKEGWKQVLAHKAEIAFCSDLPSGLRRIFSMPGQAKPLQEGRQEMLGRELEIIHTPGHTPGSICVLDRASGILFSGDTVFAEGYFGRTDIGGNEGDMYKSLQKIRKIDYRSLASGHGPVEPKEKHHSDKGM
ncbi:MAG: MBL fold metallo-hydrolase [Candidatus Micrarchaeia archaeon]